MKYYFLFLFGIVIAVAIGEAHKDSLKHDCLSTCFAAKLQTCAEQCK